MNTRPKPFKHTADISSSAPDLRHAVRRAAEIIEQMAVGEEIDFNDLLKQVEIQEINIGENMEATQAATKLTNIQKDFIEMDKKFQSEIKPFLDAFKAMKEAVALEVGIDGHFQDEEGTVYQACVPEGRFVAFDRYAVKRTRREGETKGDLSMTAARELGYVVEGK